MILCSHSGHGLLWLMQVVEGGGASGNCATTLAQEQRAIASSIRFFMKLIPHETQLPVVHVQRTQFQIIFARL